MKDPADVRISVVTPAYNAARYLPKLIDSVRRQTHRNIEHIIIDDGSTDGTGDLLSKRQGIIWVSRENRGQYASQNEGIALATGDLVVVICADDFFTNDRAFQKVANAYARNANVDVVYGKTLRYMDTYPRYYVRPDLPISLARRLIDTYLTVQHCSVFVRTELLRSRAIAFDPSYRMRGDWDWLIRVFRAATKSVGLGIDVAAWRHHPAQTSVVAEERGREETDRLLREHGISRVAHQRWSKVATRYSQVKHAFALAWAWGLSALIRRLKGIDRENKKGVRVLVHADFFRPGYKCGGPAVSLSRIMERYQGKAEFFTFTRDRDLGDTHAYPNVVPDVWTEAFGGRVYYASPGRWGLRQFMKAVHEVSPDVVYFNSYFSPITRGALLRRFLGRLRGVRVLLAPRGEFSKGALGLKATRKRVYLRMANLLHLHDRVLWHVSSPHERSDVERVVPWIPKTFVLAPDLPPRVTRSARIEKLAGQARFIFVSRIAPMKNLAHAIRLLARVRGEIRLEVYGPKEDAAYWAECEQAIAALPDSATVAYHGPVSPDDVPCAISSGHAFLLPTRGENFGHAIAEAFAATRPSLVSDRTPWRGLEAAGAGWDIPLEDEQTWVHALQTVVDWDQTAFDQATESVGRFFANVLEQQERLLAEADPFSAALIQ
jgi:glycosyltransferase involved in cell wall biosynthesis